jgi:hypothetical protein
MKSEPPLALYRKILPALKNRRRKYYETEPAYILLHELNDVTIFDCRRLPLTFVDDTGDAAFHEAQETGSQIRLPNPICYFEFSDADAIYAAELEDSNWLFEAKPGRLMGQIAHLERTCPTISTTILWDAFADLRDKDSLGIFGNGMFDIHTEKQYFYDPFDVRQTGRAKIIGKRVVGVLALLTDKLILDHVVTDPMPRITRERYRTQKLPISGPSHVLTVNVPAVRYAASRSMRRGGEHESPRLHWRRGHWRVLHRRSEFEKQAWVRRCLVGDPNKGFVRTQYRLVHESPVLTLINGGKSG